MKFNLNFGLTSGKGAQVPHKLSVSGWIEFQVYVIIEVPFICWTWLDKRDKIKTELQFGAEVKV